MKIRDFVRESFNDFPGKIASTVFVPGCNYNCPSCHAKHLLERGENTSESDFFKYLNSREGWIEAVCISGGEPTLQLGLKFFAEKLKRRGLNVKLDTNGSDCVILGELLKEELIDYVAMDVKSPLRLYAHAVGKGCINGGDYGKAINVVSQFPDYEFRTTVVPIIRGDEKISFMTVDEIRDTAKLISDYTDGSRTPRYFLQPFVPRENGLLDARLENFPETPKKLLEEMREAAKEYLPRCRIR